MKLFVCIFSDARLLPHFLSHYTRFGVSEFHIAAPPRLATRRVACPPTIPSRYTPALM